MHHFICCSNYQQMREAQGYLQRVKESDQISYAAPPLKKHMHYALGVLVLGVAAGCDSCTEECTTGLPLSIHLLYKPPTRSSFLGFCSLIEVTPLSRPIGRLCSCVTFRVGGVLMVSHPCRMPLCTQLCCSLCAWMMDLWEGAALMSPQ